MIRVITCIDSSIRYTQKLNNSCLNKVNQETKATNPNASSFAAFIASLPLNSIRTNRSIALYLR